MIKRLLAIAIVALAALVPRVVVEGHDQFLEVEARGLDRQPAAHRPGGIGLVAEDELEHVFSVRGHAGLDPASICLRPPGRKKGGPRVKPGVSKAQESASSSTAAWSLRKESEPWKSPKAFRITRPS